MYVYYALIQAHINACKMENARNLKQTNDVDNDVISSIVSVFGFFFPLRVEKVSCCIHST